MKAELLQRTKAVLSDNSIVEVVIWRVPDPVPGSGHSYKYRLFFGRNGERLVGFDNERGKGDHMHLDGVEYQYVFKSVEKLMSDFMAEIKSRRQSR